MSERQRLPMLMPLAGSPLELITIRILSDAGITDFNVVTRAQQSETLIELAVAGVGVVCVMREHAQAALESGKLLELHLPLTPLYRYAFRRPDALATEHLRLVDDFAVSLLKNDVVP